ncbi:MAG: hypothetical protein VB140_07050 [Burkholderia sp.]|nr:MAG: hypothetical protein E5299_01702 [Burkholderia gladioli]
MDLVANNAIAANSLLIYYTDDALGAVGSVFSLNRGLLNWPSRLGLPASSKSSGSTRKFFLEFSRHYMFGRNLQWNVQVHLSVTYGGVTDDGEHWEPLYCMYSKIMPMWPIRDHRPAASVV